MILISHRGNTSGQLKSWENKPVYIDKTISEGFDVEIDIWMIKDLFYLGHDEPQYEIGISWINDRSNVLWVHCKNIEALEFFNKFNYNINYFWHQKDIVTLTSKKYIWAYPGKQPIKNSIAVMPEIMNDDVSKCVGICSDFIKEYKL
jgi:hypothetical protein